VRVTVPIKRSLPFLTVGVACAWLSLTNIALGPQVPGLAPGDYPADAGPPIDALSHGHLQAFFHSHYVMGPFSLLLRAPFAALGGGDALDAYRWGALPCVLAAGLLGLYLAQLARRRGSGTIVQAALVTVCLFNPMTFEALNQGHPEEILTAALAVGAVAVASEGHTRRAALLLGLALATKQWAVIAIFPVLMALPSRRARIPVGLGAAAVALVLVLPTAIAASDTFFAAQNNVALGHRFVGFWSAWYPFVGSSADHVVFTPTDIVVAQAGEGGSTFIGRYAHPFIALVAIAVPLIFAWRRGSFRLSGPQAMALLALLALLRCVLDPVNNIYYHEPLILALVGWDALASRGIPVRSLVGAAIATLLWRWSLGITDASALNTVYLGVIGAAVVVSGRAVLGSRGSTRAGISTVAISAPRTARAS
jgi:hypothetical protein